VGTFGKEWEMQDGDPTLERLAVLEARRADRNNPLTPDEKEELSQLTTIYGICGEDPDTSDYDPKAILDSLGYLTAGEDPVIT
jgi:hypothetical protein